MADPVVITAVTGVTGIVVSGVVGPWLSNRWETTRQRREFGHERALEDRAELRQLLDEAAVTSLAASTARGAAIIALHSRDRRIDEHPEILDDLRETGGALDALSERVAVRLTREDNTASSIGRAARAFNRLLPPIAFLAMFDVEDRAGFRKELDQISKHADEFDQARERFMVEAAKLVGSRIDASERPARHGASPGP